MWQNLYVMRIVLRKVKMFMFDKPRAGINYSKYVAHCINGRSVKVK